MIIRKKLEITLIEIMIVMFLIALITGVLAYNYRGSLEQGKVFKTKAAIEKLESILNLAVAENPELNDSIEENWKDIINKSPLVKNPKDLELDGWGKPYQVERTPDGYIEIHSDGLADYEKSKK
jgi:general secretion pathway protein G